MNSFLDWAFSNMMELGGTVFGLIYVWLSIRQSIGTWPAGIITSLLYCGVFLQAKFYAGMGLQLYYFVISIYGWWSWSHGGQTGSGKESLRVSFTTPALWMRIFSLNLLLTFLIFYLLGKYSDSPLPFGDSFTTSLSIIATWMLARKKIEHWLIWIIVDMVCVGLYLYRGLYPTVFLFIVYAIMAGIGFNQWRKEPEKLPC
jgi:nicotinamide mononucleotide transporter